MISIAQAAKELAIRQAAVGTEKAHATCGIYEECQDLRFANTFEEAAALPK